MLARGPCSQRKQRVAVELGVYRVDAARQAIVRGHGQAVRLRFAQDGIRGHHANRGVGAGQDGVRQRTAQQGAAAAQQLPPVRGARTSQYLLGVRVDHIAHGVAGNQRPHRDASDRDRCRTHAALHGAGHAKQLAHAGAGACAHIALGGVGPGCGSTGRVACCCIGADAHVAHRQVEQHGGGHDGHAPYAHVQAHAMLFQPAHGAAGRIQPPGAAPREHDGMHLLDQVAGVQQIGFARAGGGAAHIHTRHGALARQDGGAARGAARVSEMAHFNAGHAGDAASIAGVGRCVHGARLWWRALRCAMALLAGASAHRRR